MVESLSVEERKARHREYSRAHRARNLEKRRQSVRDWQARNPDAVKKAEKERYGKDPVKSQLRGAKRRAAKRGQAVDGLTANLYKPACCPILGIPLDYAAQKRSGPKSPNKATLDRIDNTIGYADGNVRFISWRANRLKGDATLDELRAIVRYMETFGGVGYA